MALGSAAGTAMNFLDLFCSTQGRVGRGLYWSCVGIYLLISLLLRGSVSAAAAFTGNEAFVAIAFWAWVGFGIVCYFPMTALLVKRMHDVGRSGYWVAFHHGMLLALLLLFTSLARQAGGSLLWASLLLLVCSVGVLVVFVFSLLASDGSNEYGLSA
jgi:uncharacterized membrane protein YhaH (DUF805 family)